MSNKKRVYVITASKGGSGKTPLALSIYLVSVFLNRPIVGIDLNMNNPDFSDILKMTQNEENEPPITVSQKILESTSYNVQKINDAAYIAYNENPVLISVKDFWNELYDILIENETTANLDAIVDTAFNFYTITPPINQKLIDLFEQRDFYFFHIWSPATGMKSDSSYFGTSRFEDYKIVANRLRQISSENIEERIIHCFTPKVFIDRKLVSLFRYWKSGVFQYHKLKYEFTDRIMTLDDIQILLENMALELLKNPTQTLSLSHAAFLEAWVDVLKKYLDTHFNSRTPKNLLLIPNVYVSLATISVDLILQFSKTLETIKNNLGRFYEDIYSFLTTSPLFSGFFEKKVIHL